MEGAATASRDGCGRSRCDVRDRDPRLLGAASRLARRRGHCARRVARASPSSLPGRRIRTGRLAAVAWAERSRIGGLIALAAVVVAVVGLVDLALIPLQAWRDSGVPGWYREQLGLDYEGLSGLPENWVYNTGDEENPIRRLVSTFLSPLASAYLFVVALIYVVSRPFRWYWGLLALLLYPALLFTHTRAAFAALAVGLVLLALAQRRIAPAVLAVASVAVGALFSSRTHPSVRRRAIRRKNSSGFVRTRSVIPGASDDPFAGNEASTDSHLRNLRDGVRVVIEHPQGYGLGNAGVVAKRTGVEIRAGESTYTELGVDAGIAGVAAFVLWSLALLVGLWRKEAWLAAAFAAVLFLGLQTDVIGVHWIAFTVWMAAGLALGTDARIQSGTRLRLDRVARVSGASDLSRGWRLERQPYSLRVAESAVERLECSACGRANRPGRKFCAGCGAPLAVVCAACGAANEPDEGFCGECGSRSTARLLPSVTRTRRRPASSGGVVSVLFADLVGFTSLAEGRDAEEVRELLSRYFETRAEWWSDTAGPWRSSSATR